MFVKHSYVREDPSIVPHLLHGKGNEEIEPLLRHDRDAPLISPKRIGSTAHCVT